MVEVLVTITIIALLAGLVLTVAGAVNDKAKVTATQDLLGRVGQAIELFKTKTGFFPLPTGDAETPLPASTLTPPAPFESTWLPVDQVTSWYPSDDPLDWSGQRLWWRLSTGMSDSDVAAAREKARIAHHAADPVAADSSLQRLSRATSSALPPWVTTSQAAALDLENRVTDDEADRYWPKGSTEVGKWQSGSGMSEWREDSPNAGKSRITLQGWVKIDLLRMRGVRVRRNVERAYTTSAVLGLGEVAESYRDDDGRILDAWSEPIAYIHYGQPEEQGQRFTQDDRDSGGSTSSHRFSNDTSQSAIGRLTLEDRDGDGEASLDDLAVEPAQPVDCNGDGSIDINDWGSWCWYALPGYERGYTLISAGPDTSMHLIATESVNADNVIYDGGRE